MSLNGTTIADDAPSPPAAPPLPIARRWATHAALALQFLTVLRPARQHAVDGPLLGGSVAWFPMVGILVGVAAGAVGVGGQWLLGTDVGAVLALLTLVVVTGALHVDGLADSADGLLGGGTPERRLAIMRDSRIGAFGAAAVCLALLLEWQAIAALRGASLVAGLVSAVMLARCALVVAIVSAPYARPDGLGRLYRDHARRSTVPVAVLIAASVLVTAWGLAGIALLLVPLAVTLLLARVAVRFVGGFTGDLYGAVCVVTEIGVLVACVAALRHGWIAPRWPG